MSGYRFTFESYDYFSLRLCSPDFDDAYRTLEGNSIQSSYTGVVLCALSGDRSLTLLAVQLEQVNAVNASVLMGLALSL